MFDAVLNEHVKTFRCHHQSEVGTNDVQQKHSQNYSLYLSVRESSTLSQRFDFLCVLPILTVTAAKWGLTGFKSASGIRVSLGLGGK